MTGGWGAIESDPIPYRHPGLDPGPALSFDVAQKESGSRVKPGMTKVWNQPIFATQS